MSTLHMTINALANEFAHNLLKALRGASLDEIIAETGTTHGKRRRRAAAFVATSGQPRRKDGRLPRRTEADLARLADKIVALVASSKQGINAEGIKAALKIERKELPRPLSMALGSKKITKRGKKRATTYLKA
jgi:hypothetical protein